MPVFAQSQSFLAWAVGHKVVGVISGGALGVARTGSVGDFVNGAVVAFQIAEAFGRKP